MPSRRSVSRERDQGFSVLELLIVVAVIMILAAITVPRVLNMVSDMNLRYLATNLDGLLQTERSQAIRKNAYYAMQSTTLSTGGTGYYVHLTGGSYAAGDPLLALGSQMTVHPGTGSGAPNESTITCGTGCTFYAGSGVLGFNARGLPCAASSGTCLVTSGQGYVFFLTNTIVTGDTSWAAVVVTTAGRVQIWTCDGAGNWVQRN